MSSSISDHLSIASSVRVATSIISPSVTHIASTIVGSTLSNIGSYWSNDWGFFDHSNPEKTIWQMLNEKKHEQVRFNHHEKPPEPPHYHVKSQNYDVKIFINRKNKPSMEEFPEKAKKLKNGINGLRKSLEKDE